MSAESLSASLPQQIAILGATGSIGASTLDVIARIRRVILFLR